MSLIAVLVLATVVATPNPGRVEITLDAARSGFATAKGSNEVVVRATPIGGRQPERAAPVETPATVPGKVSLSLARDVLWRFEVVSGAWWAAAATAYLTDDTFALRLRAWPTATVTGALKWPSSEQAPTVVKLDFQAPAKAQRSAGPMIEVKPGGEPRGATECRVAAGRFRCSLPAALLDVKLRCKGYVSIFRWAQRLDESAPLDLGEMVLIPGASLVGWVTTAEGPASPESCTARPPPAARGPAAAQEEAARGAALTQTTTIDGRGFFTFEGLGAGSYEVVASQPGFAPFSTGRLTIMARSETTLRETLVFERPAQLRISVRPRVDPSGQPWSGAVFRAGLIPGAFEPAAHASVNEDGTLAIEGLTPGTLRVTLFDSAGSQFAQQRFDLSPATSDLLFDVPAVQVSGRVLLGRKPLAAKVWFGRRAGSVSVLLESDADGDFVGVLPRAGSWDVQVVSDDPVVDRVLRKVDVMADPETRRAEVELRVPATRLEGTVVDEHGGGVAGATVRLLATATDSLTQIRSNDGGRFEIHGPAPGRISLQARDVTPDGPRESATAYIDVPSEGDAPQIRLTLVRKREVRGVLLGDGQPVPGAQVSVAVFPLQPASLANQDVTTDSAGRFVVQVQGDARGLLAYAFPPGYAFRAFVVDVTVARDVELKVTAFGGDLEIGLPEPADFRDPTKPKWALWQDGIVVGPAHLSLWARINGQLPDPSPTYVRVPRLNPGNYRVCFFGDNTTLLRAVGTGPAPDVPCAEGYLPPLGRLQLRPGGGR